ncbi:MAG: phosphatidate cytidylyltransferase, partial [Gammaproteobacteria bacterium]|nr:phosphatidate cytidylyltransferase [Gammaproteobacteria bacterium]
SAIKRHRGKKDFAALSRMHGGILDIYDSLLFAVPAFYLLRTLVSS